MKLTSQHVLFLFLFSLLGSIVWIHQASHAQQSTIPMVTCPTPDPLQVTLVEYPTILHTEDVQIHVDTLAVNYVPLTATIQTLSGVFTRTGTYGTQRDIHMSIDLLPNTVHPLTVTAQVSGYTVGDCTYNPYEQSTSTNIEGNPLIIEQMDALNPDTDLFLQANQVDNGRLAFHMSGVFGPDSCTSLGDPFSPSHSPFHPDNEPYAYRYQIRIPADYPDDVVRVELFDPDSINNTVFSTTVQHTQPAIQQGDPLQENLSCSRADQRNPCHIDTGEDEYVGTQSLTIEDINPFWFVRVDENRKSRTEQGSCYSLYSYAPEYNTQTRYELFYYDDAQGRIDLASYTGQTGDSIRDAGDHQTDLRWVSPGAPNSFGSDISGTVPVDADSPATFQINLESDLPNIDIDPITGDRLLQLTVTTLSGASENVFAIWAGPDDYVATTPSDANLRNVQLLNDPMTHDAHGVIVEAINFLPMNNSNVYPTSFPLIDIPASYAGETVYVGLYDMDRFDIDTDALPPITFTLDSLDNHDWEQIFSQAGVDDPDGVPDGIRCRAGGCHTRWVDPMYTIQIPGDISDCDWLNPNPNDCTPFTGGKLRVHYTAGEFDTFVWQVYQTEPQTTHDHSQSCASMPIGLFDEVRSVTAPNTGSTPYPLASTFAHPTTPPDYTDFVAHVPNAPLLSANEGSIYQLHIGDTAEFLHWNNGKRQTAVILSNSLSWPGDTLDYADHGDSGAPASAHHAHVVRGYVNPYDNQDLYLQGEDWVGVYQGVMNTTAVTSTLDDHIDTGRILRLPIYEQAQGNNVRVTRFGRFQLHGYNLNTPEPWLLVTFEGWDDSCGVTLQLTPNQAETLSFMASIAGTDIASATYSWQITGQSPITTSGVLTDSQPFTGDALGLYLVEVTAVANTSRTQLPLQEEIGVFISPIIAGDP